MTQNLPALRRRLNAMAARRECAQTLARDLVKGTWDDDILSDYTKIYFEDAARRRSRRALLAGSTQEWINWKGEQVAHTTALIRLERQRPVASRLEALWTMTPVAEILTRADTAAIDELAQQCRQTIAGIHEQTPIPRDDLQAMLDNACAEDHSPLLRQINTADKFNAFAGGRHKSSFDANISTADAIIRGNESEMAATILLVNLTLKRSKNARARISAMADLRRIGRYARAELSAAGTMMQVASEQVDTMQALASRQNESRGSKPAALAIH